MLCSFGSRTRQQADAFLRARGADVKSGSEYVTYKFPDKSTVTIRLSDGRVSRTPPPRYGPDGRNINKGLRLGKDGSLLQTRDRSGNPIPQTHDTGEFVR